MGNSRRDFLRWSLGSAGGLTLGALATGLPISFLRHGRVLHAQDRGSATHLVLSVNASGAPLNVNCPGSYAVPGDMNDVRHRIERASVAELGNGALGVVGGVEYGAADFEEGFECRLGDVVTRSARPWAELPEAVRSRMSVIRHRTYTNAHPEFSNVTQFHGAVKGPGRIGVESLPSMIAQETAGVLGSILEAPLRIGGPGFLFRGGPLREQTPDRLHDLFSESGSFRGLTSTEFADFRDHALDQIYRDTREHGTHAQRAFLDANVRSRDNARALAETLNASLQPIATTGNAVEKQVLAAAALIEHNVAPVVTIQLPFGGDNHQDSQLEVEVSETLAGLEGIRRLHEELTLRGVADRTTFAYLAVFGRTLGRGGSGGRGHYGDDHAMVMFGPNVRPGLHGGLIDDGSSRRPLKAGPIGDVPIEETLSAAGKTLAKACGIPDDTIEERIVGGRALF